LDEPVEGAGSQLEQDVHSLVANPKMAEEVLTSEYLNDEGAVLENALVFNLLVDHVFGDRVAAVLVDNLERVLFAVFPLDDDDLPHGALPDFPACEIRLSVNFDVVVQYHYLICV
jgi:hypothetical protein